MKKIFALALALLMMFGALAMFASCGSDEIENDENTFIVVTNCPFEPFEYVGDDGKLYGIDIEIAKGYADSRGLTLVIKNLPQFDPIFDEVKTGKADIGMAGITISEDRLTSFDFTTAYYNASQKIIVPASCTDFDACETAEDVENVLKALSGQSIGYQTGTTGNWYVAGDEDWGYDGFSNVTAKGYDTALDAINDMINGNLYAVVVDEAPGTAMVNSISGNKVKVIDIKLTNEEYAFLIQKGNTALQDDFNAYLEEIKENGEFQKILDKYFKGEGTKVGVTQGNSN